MMHFLKKLFKKIVRECILLQENMEKHKEELAMASLGVRVTFKEDIQNVWDVITSVDKYLPIAF